MPQQLPVAATIVRHPRRRKEDKGPREWARELRLQELVNSQAEELLQFKAENARLRTENARLRTELGMAATGFGDLH